MNRYLTLILLAILVMTSGLVAGCGQKGESPATPTPIAPTTSTALKDYFNEALPIVEDHTRTMDTVYEAIEAIKAFYSQPPQPTGIQAITVEGIVAALKAKVPLASGIYKMEKALHKVDSEIVDFGILSPPVEAMYYHNLITNCFLKHKVALSDWLNYYTSFRERGFRDNEILERADRHYDEARELQLQAEQEWGALQQEMRE